MTIAAAPEDIVDVIDPEQEVIDPQVAERDREARRKAFEDALVNFCKAGTDAAIPLSQTVKRRWHDYISMKEGTWKADDPSDPLVKLGVYIRAVAKYIRLLKASVLLRLIPDPASLDIFSASAKWEGLEAYAMRIEALIRDKFKIMIPEAAANFYDLADRQIDDDFTLGNICAIVTHEYYDWLDHDDGDGLTEGPVAQYVSPFNVWPWRTRANSMKQTPVSVYDPLERGQLLEGDFFNVDLVLEREQAEDLPDWDPASLLRTERQGGNRQDSTVEQETNEQVAGRYKRYHLFTPLPAHALGKPLGLDQVGQDGKAARFTAEDVALAIADLYDLDPVECVKARWWLMGWIGETLIYCRPYPLGLPQGRSPLVHHTYAARNGYVWGQGLFDLIKTDERLMNSFLRSALSASQLMSRPPFYYFKDLVEADWLQRQGGSIKGIQPNMGIPLSNALGLTQAPIKTMDYNSNSIGVSLQNADRLEAGMREQTGVTTALEGQDRSDTATQNANNLQQSMIIVDYTVTRLEQYLKDLAERVYVVTCQAMKLGDVSAKVPMSYQENQLRAVEIRPEHLLSLSLIDIQITGSASPLNMASQIMVMKDVAQLYGPTGKINFSELIKAHLMMGKIRDPRRFLVEPDQMSDMERASNAVAAFGGRGVQFLPPDLLMRLYGMPMAPPGMGMGAGMGMGGGMPQGPGAPMPMQPGGGMPMGGAGTPGQMPMMGMGGMA